VTRKTIAFTMPATGSRPRQRAPVDLDALGGDSARVSASGADDARIAAEPEGWVRDRDLRLEVDPPPPSARESRATIDLAAERNLMEVVSLSFLVPFALGWFWFVNAMNRRTRFWAG
jgi:hypothetical protein